MGAGAEGTRQKDLEDLTTDLASLSLGPLETRSTWMNDNINLPSRVAAEGLLAPACFVPCPSTPLQKVPSSPAVLPTVFKTITRHPCSGNTPRRGARLYLYMARQQIL